MGVLDSFSEQALSSRTAILNMGLDLLGIAVAFVLYLQFGVSLVLGMLVAIIVSAVVAGGYFFANR